MATTTARRSSLGRGLLLEYFTVGWNVLEAVVGLVAGVAAGSVALVGFALDSVVEASSGSVLIWRLRSERDGRRSLEQLERRAVKLVAVAFLALGLYVGTNAVLDLVARNQPEASPPGIALAVVSLIVMPILAHRKRKVARDLDSRALQADATQTNLCTFLSGFLLVGLVANAWFGWWWADPAAGVVIALFAINEARELFQADALDGCC